MHLVQDKYLNAERQLQNYNSNLRYECILSSVLVKEHISLRLCPIVKVHFMHGHM